MANPQLEGYIKKQVAKGVSKDAIKSALLGVGWQENVVTEALSSVEAPAAAPVETAASPTAASPTSTASASLDTLIAGASSPAADQPVVETITGASPSLSSSEPAAASSKAGSSSFSVKRRGKPVMLIVFVALTVLLAAAAGYLWYENQNLRAAAAPSPADVGALQSQIASLTNAKNGLTAKVTDLTNQLNDVSGQLSAFAVPQPDSPEIPITLQGVLGGGGKSSYTVLTSSNVLFTIKNSKDPAVAALLKPAVAAPVIIAGTHAVGSHDVIVTAVNGVAPGAAASPAATGTTPK